jgi:hypothetical protein
MQIHLPTVYNNVLGGMYEKKRVYGFIFTKPVLSVGRNGNSNL